MIVTAILLDLYNAWMAGRLPKYQNYVGIAWHLNWTKKAVGKLVILSKGPMFLEVILR